MCSVLQTRTTLRNHARIESKSMWAVSEMDASTYEGRYSDKAMVDAPFREWLACCVRQIHDQRRRHNERLTLEDTRSAIVRRICLGRGHLEVDRRTCAKRLNNYETKNKQMPLELTLRIAKLARDELHLSSRWGGVFLRKWSALNPGCQSQDEEVRDWVSSVWGPWRRRHITSNLKSPISDLVGRDTDIQNLEEKIAQGHQRIVLNGPGGIGKSAIADHLARRCLLASTEQDDQKRHLWFDAIVRVSAKSEEIDPESFVQVVHVRDQVQATVYAMFDEIARQLRPELLLTGTTEQRMEQLARVLDMAGRVLLVFDNLESLEDSSRDIEVFLAHYAPITAYSVLTTRKGRGGPGSYDVGELPLEAALDVLATQYRDLRMEIPPISQLTDIVDKLGGNPAALRYAVSAALARAKSVAEIIGDLVVPGMDIADHMFGMWANAMRANKNAYRLLGAIALFSRGPRWIDAQRVSGLLDHVTLAAAAREAVTAWPGIVYTRGDQVLLERLSRQYMLNHLGQPSNEETLAGLRSGLAEWAVNFAEENGGPEWTDWEMQFRPLDNQWLTILNACSWLETKGDWNLVWRIWAGGGKGVDTFAHLFGHWEPRKKWLTYIANCARATNRPAILSRALTKVGFTNWLQGDESEASKCYAEALSHIDTMDWYGQARLRVVIGALHAWKGDVPASDSEFSKALSTAQEYAGLEWRMSGRIEGEIRMWQGVARLQNPDTGPVASEIGKATRAIDSAFKIAEDIGWERLALYSKQWAARINTLSGRFSIAEAVLQEGIAKSQKYREKRLEAGFRLEFACLLRAKRKVQESRGYFDAARRLYSELGMIDSVADVDREKAMLQE